MREAEEAALKAASDQSIATAQASVNALLDNGKVWALNGREPQVMTPNGKVTNFDWQGYATQALAKQTEGLTEPALPTPPHIGVCLWLL